MEAIGSISSIIAIVQIAGSIAKLCGGYIADVKDAPKDIERLQQKVITLGDLLQRMADASGLHGQKLPRLSDKLSNAVNSCLKDLERLQEKLQRKKRDKAMSKFGLRALTWPLTKSTVDEEIKKMENYLVIFNAALQLDHIVISHGISNKLDMSNDDQLLRTISRVGDAAYDSYENQRHRPCYPQTRVDLLREITNWANSRCGKYIFWLRGRAGTGKSTIALTVAQHLGGPGGAALASFFFKRGGGELARSRRLISTIVFQLATQSRLFGSFVCEALRDHPHLGDSASLSQQYDKLLYRPLQQVRQSAAQSLSFLVILDALDECDDLDDVRLFLRLLGGAQDMADQGLRVLVTSRPEVPIRLGFQYMKHIAYYELALHDIPRAVVDRDIQTFVTHELAQIQAERQLPDFWADQNQIDTIITRANGLFIYAATVCRYVDGPWQVSPTERLKQICQASHGKHKSMEALDTMYNIILTNSITGDFSVEELYQFTTRLRRVLGCIVLLFDNLSAEALARLISTKTPTSGRQVQETLVSLHAVLDVPEDLNELIQTQHLSFRDFLVDSTRCPDSRFQINQQQMHDQLSSYCLDLMKQSLTQDICRLSRPGFFIKDISEVVLRRYLPSELRYACHHWVSHIRNGQVSLSDHGPVHRFLQHCCLYWLEAMYLMSRASEAVTIIIQLDKSIQVSEAPELHSLVQDMLRFMLAFSHVLTQAPLQLYSAGLIFSPIGSVFRRLFHSQASILVYVETQLPLEWNACTQTLEGHSDTVRSVVFSPDGSRVASGSNDRIVRVWDVQTGHCQHTLEGHSDWVSSVVFSPDGLHVVSGSDDGTVRVWDVQTGQCQYTLEGHSDWVSSVVFSLDGSRVASGSNDGTVRVWDVQTGQCQHTLEGHSDIVSSVIFSPDGSRVASGSNDRTVRVWDVQTGQCQHTLEGYSHWVSSVVFSPDGLRVASGSKDRIVRVWDVQTGQCQYTLEGHSNVVRSVVFSPDGSRVASRSKERTVRVWDAQTGQCQHMLEGHSDIVSSVVFSPDGSRVVSSSDDRIVRVWDVQTGQCQYTLEGHSDWVSSVVFSPDGSRVASGSDDGTVRVWDVQTERYQSTLEGHSGWVSSVVFSPDGSRVVSSSDDGTARVWDVQTGQCQYTLEGHSDIVSSVIFSLDGSRVASGSNDGTVRVWDVQTGQCQSTLEGHSDIVSSVVFSPDGSRVASGSNDGTVWVWDIATSREIFRFDSGTHNQSIAFSNDSTEIHVNNNLLTILPHTPLPSPTAVPSDPDLNIISSKLAVADDWVTLSSEQILWLPPEYRGCWASHGESIVVGSATGRVSFFRHPIAH